MRNSIFLILTLLLTGCKNNPSSYNWEPPTRSNPTLSQSAKVESMFLLSDKEREQCRNPKSENEKKVCIKKEKQEVSHKILIKSHKRLRREDSSDSGSIFGY